MQYRPYGNQDIQLSALGFGCMRLPMEDGHVLEEPSIEMIRHAIDSGVNYVDSAYGYCGSESEIVLGKALQDGYREKVYLATKNPKYDQDGSIWRAALDDQLQRLQTDYIDFYHQHGLNWKAYQDLKPVKGGPFDQFQRALDEGLIKHRVFSFHDKAENLFPLVDTGEFDGVLLQYNLLDRSNEAGLAYAAGKGMGVVVMGPVGGGRLGQPSAEIAKLIPGGVKSTAEAAIRFVLANPNVTCALSGMTKLPDVVENLQTASREEALSAAEKAHLQTMMEENKKLAELYCTGCDYCLPCPNNVAISENFRIMNYHRVYGLTDHAKEQYRRLERKRVSKEERVDARAVVCVECGECIEKCPQNIPIIDQLKEVHATLGA